MLRVILMRRMFMTMAIGLDTIPAETMRTTTSTIPGSMDISSAGLDRRMYGVWAEEGRIVSGLAASTLA
jgi:hypothetical protein